MLDTICGRLLLAVMSLTIGLILFRAQLADALVVRGDDLLIQNAYGDAAQRYARALWLDPRSGVAIDRLMFVALQQRKRGALRSAVALASRYLRTRPDEPSILFDRALCYLKLRNYPSAYLDFFHAARMTEDPEQYTFAGWAASRAGRVAQAAALWRLALRIRHDYRPAAMALAELKR
jgi:tetratricopeptide (TPR) repeat protein